MENENNQNKNWFAKHKILTGFLFLFLFFIIVASIPEENTENIQKINIEKKDESINEKEDEIGTQIKTENNEEKKEEIIEANPTPTSSETISQKNAVKKAKLYLDYSAFSYNGLVKQLEYEQFSHDDAVYGADNSGADWNEQAAKKAKSYMDYSAFSRGGLIDQLKHEGFTQSQAEYGVNTVGL